MLLLLASACKPAKTPPAQPKPGAGPQMQATVVTIQTTINKNTTAHAIVIAGNRARSTDEQDAWRLYDTRANTVTFVDDITRTYRTEKLDAILQARRAKLAQAMPAHIPAVKAAETNDTKVLHGVQAQRSVVSAGNYKRDLWIANHPQIPPRLFAMMQASDPPSTELAPMMRAADEALVTTEGFPLADRTEVANTVVDRNVMSIVQKPMSEALLAIPRDYRDVTPKPPAAAKKGSKAQRLKGSEAPQL